MSQTIDLGLASLVSGQSSGYVVEDTYVKGGYRVVTVDPQTWTDANNDPANQAYQAALADEAASGTEGSLKIGCLVFDITSSRNFRCTKVAPDPVEFVEVFANDGSIDESRFVQRAELPQDANGSIDIASEATLQEALLSSVRVSGTSQAPTVNLGVFEIAQDNPDTPLIQIIAIPADPATSTPAQVNLIVNPFAAANAASA